MLKHVKDIFNNAGSAKKLQMYRNVRKETSSASVLWIDGFPENGRPRDTLSWKRFDLKGVGRTW